MKKINVGVIGYGALGKKVIHLVNQNKGLNISGVLRRQKNNKNFKKPYCILNSVKDFLSLNHDVVIECASQSALKDIGISVLSQGFDLIPASIGAFSDNAFLTRMVNCASKRNVKIRLSSGAIIGIDGVKAAKQVGIQSVHYKGIYSPQAFKTNYKHGSNCVFSGNAREFTTKFPGHSNITAIISLAGIGFDKTQVSVFVDSEITDNKHILHMIGSFGEIKLEVNGKKINTSSPSSVLTAGSLVNTVFNDNYTTLSL